MKALRFTRMAEDDLASAYDYTVANFGTAQWDSYERSLKTALADLPNHPALGIDFSAVRPNVRRLIHRGHAIYYRIEIDHILVLRILGIRQDSGRHL
ncbi:type II toxin-antitoxin system RelE/ParE family toxin [Rhizobium sp. GN54]|uniref:type II toxin-antitoxin system RelE/ParE family toxin n=1 Tax=Rhizobium sp. GN54 TaxID=2898150 RepID=UPI0022A99275|nr:type II toxin-antitoxin system RelE/ParE family toxin [Rhizobium sp. GN54]